MGQISGFDPKIQESGAQLELPGATIHFRSKSVICRADLSLLPDMIAKLLRQVAGLKGMGGIFIGHTRRMVGKLKFAGASVMGGVGRVARFSHFTIFLREW